jgi:predicted O-methyltransferase YrrM
MPDGGPIARYLFTATRAAGVLLAGPFTQAGRKSLAALSFHLGWQRHRSELPVVSIDALVPAVPVELLEVSHNPWNTSLFEQCVLARVARHVAPQRIFEFGTYDGRTCVNLLINSPVTASATTIDLPPGVGDANAERGVRLANERITGRVTQLFGDCRTYDFSRYTKQMDLVFIDAGHGYESARADTASAMKMVSERGWIVWHDYAGIFPGVTRAVDELARAAPAGRRMVRVEGSSLAVCLPV